MDEPVTDGELRSGTEVSLTRTDRGRRLEISREVKAPASMVWEILTDVSHWPEWGPPVTAVDTSTRTITADTIGRVRVFGLFWVPFQIEQFDRLLWTWSVWGLTPPADGHRVVEIDDQRSRAVLELPLWAPWYLLLCWFALRNIAVVARRRAD